jgi:hypothetical protein
MAGTMIAWGDAPGWFAAVGTVGALGISLYLIWNERNLRVNQQARRVAVWAEWKRTGRPDSNPRQYYAYINNSSDSPVFVELMSACKTSTGNPLEEVIMGVVAPHDIADYGLRESLFSPDSDPPYIKMTFRDIDRVRWHCDSSGLLRKA